MTRKFLLFACVAFIAASAAASDKADAIAPVRQFADGMNKGHTKTALAAFADETAIIDDLAPHYWHGKGAGGQWLAAVDADARKNGMTDGVLSLKKPTNVKINGENAYAVFPIVYTYKLKGKPGRGSGTMTVALRKGTDGWRMTAFAFSVR